VSEDLASVVQAALRFSEDSGGAFDVTVAPLVAAWGFGTAERTPRSLPEPAVLDALRANTGYEKLQVRMRPPALRKDAAEVQIDLNAIAPGYAVDQLSERLSSMGVEHYMINLGGEVRVQGRNAQGAAWRIATERPVDGEPVPYAIMRLSDLAVTTSGEYRRYYELDGQRYSHTIDPRTARPVQHSLASVVVIGPTSMYTDGWATALNVLGAQAGHDLAVRRDIAAMFIEWRDGRLHWRATPGFEAHMSWSETGE
jgi:thiamine biosynthesis lipoprotein